MSLWLDKILKKQTFENNVRARQHKLHMPVAFFHHRPHRVKELNSKTRK